MEILPSVPVSESEKAGDLADAVAHRVPGDVGLAEAELLHHRGLHLEAVGAERGERSDRAAEFADQNARAQLRQPFAVALHRGEQRRGLEAEGQRHGLLQVAAARHRGVAVAPRKLGERRGDRLHVLFHQFERGADLHDRGGVGDVLRGGAPMAPLAEPVGAQIRRSAAPRRGSDSRCARSVASGGRDRCFRSGTGARSRVRPCRG